LNALEHTHEVYSKRVRILTASTVPPSGSCHLLARYGGEISEAFPNHLFDVYLPGLEMRSLAVGVFYVKVKVTRNFVVGAHHLPVMRSLAVGVICVKVKKAACPLRPAPEGTDGRVRVGAPQWRAHFTARGGL
jgi:hypothetical protein